MLRTSLGSAVAIMPGGDTKQVPVEAGETPASTGYRGQPLRPLLTPVTSSLISTAPSWSPSAARHGSRSATPSEILTARMSSSMLTAPLSSQSQTQPMKGVTVDVGVAETVGVPLGVGVALAVAVELGGRVGTSVGVALG